MTRSYEVHLRQPHERQAEFIYSQAKRTVVRAGRRSGKTTGAAVLGIEKFLDGCRVLYAAPTEDQVEAFWWEVSNALAKPVDAGVFYKNETRHLIERKHTKQRIRAKTAWDANTMRGDFADVLILDEYQLMCEDAWEYVGAPMLLDNDGDAWFIYTPPSLRTAGRSKARDPRHAAKLFRRAQSDETGRWRTVHFTSRDNPHISGEALVKITEDMTRMAIRQEIDAEDLDENPAALWKRRDIDDNRVTAFPALSRVVVGVDPTATAYGDEAGVVVVGKSGEDYYVLDDASRHGSPEQWASAVVAAYSKARADRVIAEANNGGEMVESTIRVVDNSIPVKLIHASRGKATRAEPVVALYEKARVHHVGDFSALENEMLMWAPGDASPNRMDALVWAVTELMADGGQYRWTRRVE